MLNSMLVLVAVAALMTIVAATLILRARARKRARPRTVELPNSAYTPKLVLDRDTHHRWQLLPLDQLHEINRAEVVRLLDQVAAAGVDSLHRREREFLDNLADRYLRDIPRRPGSTVNEFAPAELPRNRPPSAPSPREVPGRS